MQSRRHSRPLTARAVAGRSSSLQEFGYNLRDWFHELRAIGTKADFLGAVSHRPPRLKGRFDGGEIADAFLAAQVDYLCAQAGLPSPSWTAKQEYVLDNPWFGYTALSDPLRAMLIRDADPQFVNRNIFTNSEIVWKPRRGRPAKSPEALREANRERQRRWRARKRGPTA